MRKKPIIFRVVVVAGLGTFLSEPFDAQPQGHAWASQERQQAEEPVAIQETPRVDESPNPRGQVGVTPQRPSGMTWGEIEQPVPRQRSVIQPQGPTRYIGSGDQPEGQAQQPIIKPAPIGRLPGQQFISPDMDVVKAFDEFDVAFEGRYREAIGKLKQAVVQNDWKKADTLAKELTTMLAKDRVAPQFCDGCYWCWPSCDDPVICFCPGGGCGDIIFEKGCMR